MWVNIFGNFLLVISPLSDKKIKISALERYNERNFLLHLRRFLRKKEQFLCWALGYTFQYARGRIMDPDPLCVDAVGNCHLSIRDR